MQAVLTALALLVCTGAGIIGGVFFAFSVFVMKALAELPAAHGIAAMQRINVVVLNRLFLGVFMGTALLALAMLAAAIAEAAPRSPWLIASALLYLAGSFAVTLACNVPRNERLARMAAESTQAADYWRAYVREWTRWNHVRTIASIASSVCAASAGVVALP